MTPHSATSLLQALVRCPSVTPDAGAALDVVEQTLQPLGFACHRLEFADGETPAVDNLFARRGSAGPHLCFAGHVDVVPPGDESRWSEPPFAGAISDGRMIGRGCEDMKGAIAAALAATARFLDRRDDVAGSISFLITGDEEGPAVNGTVKVLEWMAANGEIADACLLGEPTNRDTLGDVMKIGRRGSLTGHLTVRGRQGHVAYPALADNPVPLLIRLLDAVQVPLDKGTAHFEASNLEVTTVDIANPATNVIPAEAHASFNVRFNDTWTAASLEACLRERLVAASKGISATWELQTESNAESFVTEPGPFVDLVRAVVSDTTGITPILATNGGTSDARFITRHCPVVEFGLVGRSMHQIDEFVPLVELERLADIYHIVLERFFAPA